MKKPISWSTIIIVLALLYLWADVSGNGGGSGNSTPKNPHPASTICNQYFKGGC